MIEKGVGELQRKRLLLLHWDSLVSFNLKLILYITTIVAFLFNVGYCAFNIHLIKETLTHERHKCLLGNTKK